VCGVKGVWTDTEEDEAACQLEEPGNVSFNAAGISLSES
jgi:hypothetical protein